MGAEIEHGMTKKFRNALSVLPEPLDRIVRVAYEVARLADSAEDCKAEPEAKRAFFDTLNTYLEQSVEDLPERGGTQELLQYQANVLSGQTLEGVLQSVSAFQAATSYTDR